MNDESVKIRDGRLYLKVKIKSLAEEAKIIRHEENKNHPRGLWWGLRLHRTRDVRREARSALLAYGFLRGRSYESMESSCHTPPDWTRVRSLVEKYGKIHWTSDWGAVSYSKHFQELKDRFEAWRNPATRTEKAA